MTVVAAAHLSDKIVIGCDSLISEGDSRVKASNFSKLIEFGDGLIIGFAGTTTIYHILKKKQRARKNKLKPPKTTDECYSMCKPLFLEFKKEMERCLTFEKSEESGIDLIVITADKIFTCNEFSAEEHDQYCAIGSGQDFARGNLYSTYPNKNCILDSLKAACYHCLSCGTPVIIKEIAKTQ